MSQEQEDRLLRFIRTALPAEAAIGLAEMRRLPGGFAKETFFLELTGTLQLPRHVVMRRDRSFSASGTSVREEFPLIKALHDSGVPVPKPYLVDAKGDVFGFPFMLVERIAGGCIGDFVDITEPSRDAALDFARVLAHLHTLPTPPFAGLVKGGTSPTRERVLADIEQHERDWRALPSSAFVTDAAYAWLRRNIDLADGHRTVIHRDPLANNLLIDHGRVTALLDWERCSVGNPAEDLGCIYYMITQMVDWPEFLSVYETAAGHTVPQEQIDFYTLWGALRVATSVSRAHHAVISGTMDDLQIAYSGAHFVQRLLHRISSKVTELLR